MATPILKLHKVTVTGASPDDAKVYYCSLRPGTYTSISSIVGITEATDTEQNNVRSDVAELIRAGVLFRMVCSGGTATARKSFNLLVTKDKIATAMDAIKGKSINGTTVGAGRVKRTATFY
jgi:hypothetical protein